MASYSIKNSCDSKKGILTKVNKHNPALTSKNLMVLSRDPETRIGPIFVGNVPFVSPFKCMLTETDMEKSLDSEKDKPLIYSLHTVNACST